MSRKANYWIKRVLIAGLVAVAIGAGIAWYLFTEMFEDTGKSESAYSVEAISFINEFEKGADAANKKYAEKIITVSGKVGELEQPSDTLTNIKFINDSTGSYAIFSFQHDQATRVRQVKTGDSISIKGSCSGGNFSEILSLTSIEFKRCVLDKIFNK